MSLFELVDMCFRNLIRRKLRTILTVIGVVIGTCAIVIMVSFGVALNEYWSTMLQSYGSLTRIEVLNYDYGDGQYSEKPTLDDKLLEEWKGIEGVTAVTPVADMNVSLSMKAGKNGRYTSDWANMVGVYPDAVETMGLTLKSGRFWENDSSSKTIPVLVGENFAYTFKDSKKPESSAYVYEGMVDATGQEVKPFVDVDKDEITIYTEYEENKTLEWKLKIVGVVNKDYAVDYRTDNGIYMRIEDMKRIEQEVSKAQKIKTTKTKSYNDVYVWVNTIDDVTPVEDNIKNQGFETYSMESERKSMEQSSMTIQMVLGGLGAVSLFVAAIGITNTMIMSIYERTKEIGIMKALGCYVRDIRRMFLIEAGAIGLTGGVIGLILSYTASALLNVFGGNMMSGMMGGGMMDSGEQVAAKLSVIPVWLAVLALVFSTLIGLIAGYAPARRAVKISALEAIRSN